MNHSHFTPFVIFIGSLTFLLVISLQSQASTVSGRVVDESENPVPDITVAIKSYKGNVVPDRRRMHMHEPMFPPPQPSNTDATGVFSVDNIVSPSVNQLTLFPERDPEYEIRSIEMQGIALNIHPHQFSWHGGFPFGIEEEIDIKDVKITVRLRMRIRGQVLAEDGTPLSNAQVNLRVSRRSTDGTSRGSSGGTRTLDIDGNFVEFINRPAHYTVSVTYQGQSAESKEILLEEGQRLDGLTLILNGEPQQHRKPNVVRQPVPIRDPKRMQAAWQRQREGVWAINPVNRHAYKRIYCQTHEEALEQATTQGAHLIAINDKAEQEWILEVFGKENYWVGTINDTKDGAKQWENGDPVTYTNWDSKQLIPESDKSVEKDEKTTIHFTVLIGVTGKWQQIREGSPVASITEKAILEKKDLIIGVPEIE